MIGNKIADKITSVSKKTAIELHSKELRNNDNNETDVEIATPKKRYMSPEERQQIIELRLVPKKYVWIKIHIFQRKVKSMYELRYISSKER